MAIKMTPEVKDMIDTEYSSLKGDRASRARQLKIMLGLPDISYLTIALYLKDKPDIESGRVLLSEKDKEDIVMEYEKAPGLTDNQKFKYIAKVRRIPASRVRDVVKASKSYGGYGEGFFDPKMELF